ncbi:MAG: B12-binding domain-containing radical SAM protein, partial [Desulfobacteraceae bacterium]|nr:B12-binding domain-containing radical SAM protein [Desulfobacteraceae bacterium]
MNKKNIQEILPLVEMPSRYLGCEANTIKKHHSSVDLTFALAFPDLYEIGTSHFGMQILYTILNQEPNITAERFFTPAQDMEQLLREKNTPLFSLESKTDLKAFDIIGFSLLYELNFTNILTMLDLSDIPFYADQRGEEFPLVIAGGPCAFNPEPLADIFDLFVIGDGEEAILEISKRTIKWKRAGEDGKKELLKELATIQGVYVPSFYTPSFSDRDFQTLTPLYPEHATVKRAVLSDLDKTPFPTAPIVPFGKPVHDRLRLEIARGCSRGCRFCQAGMIYRPVRERSVTDLMEITQKALKETGYS